MSIHELKNLIKINPEQCKDLPKCVCEFLHEVHDEDNDGKLSFEEFYKLSRKNHWVVADWCTKYCEYIIPPRCAAKHHKLALPQAASAFDQVDQG